MLYSQREFGHVARENSRQGQGAHVVHVIREVHSRVDVKMKQL